MFSKRIPLQPHILFLVYTSTTFEELSSSKFDLARQTYACTYVRNVCISVSVYVCMYFPDFVSDIKRTEFVFCETQGTER